MSLEIAIWRWASAEHKCDACGQPIKAGALHFSAGPLHVHGETPDDCPVEPLPEIA